MRRLLLGALLATACAELPDIESRGTCGDRIVELSLGEDCDTVAPAGATCGAPEGPRACRLVCVEDPLGLATSVCPSGFACGLDGVCRQSSALFAAPVALELPPRPVAEGADAHLGVSMSDFDGDQRMDLAMVRFGRPHSLRIDELAVAWGDAAGRFEAVSTAPIGSAADQVASVQGDPTAVELPWTNAVVVPQNVPATFSPPGDSREIAPWLLPYSALEEKISAVVSYQSPDGPSTRLIYATEDPQIHESSLGPLRLPALAGSPLGSVDVDVLTPVGSEEVALWSEGVDTLYLVTFDPEGVQTTSVALPGPLVSAPVAFERDLIVTVGAPEQPRQVFTLRGDGSGVFQAQLESALPYVERCGEDPNSAVEAVLDTDQDGEPEYVLSNALVWRTTGGVLPTCLPLGYKTLGDFDGDGVTDLIVAPLQLSPPPVVYLLTALGVRELGAMSVPDPLSRSFVSDMDLDGADDLVYVTKERTLRGAGGVHVIYGTKGGFPEAPRRIGFIPEIHEIAVPFVVAPLRGGLLRPQQGLEVYYRLPNDTVAIAGAFGLPSRAFAFIRPGTSNACSSPQAIVSGHFTFGPNDVAAGLLLFDCIDLQQLDPRIAIQRLDARDGRGPSGQTFFLEPTGCPDAVVRGAAEFEVRRPNEVIAKTEDALLRLTTEDGNLTCEALPFEGVTKDSRVFLVDVDRDARLDVLVVTNSRRRGPRFEVLLDGAVVTLDTGLRFFVQDVLDIDADGDGVRELAISSHVGLYIWRGLGAVPEWVGRGGAFFGQQTLVGDVDGDRLDDLVLVDDQQQISVARQLSTNPRDAR